MENYFNYIKKNEKVLSALDEKYNPTDFNPTLEDRAQHLMGMAVSMKKQQIDNGETPGEIPPLAVFRAVVESMQNGELNLSSFISSDHLHTYRLLDEIKNTVINLEKVAPKEKKGEVIKMTINEIQSILEAFSSKEEEAEYEPDL